MHALVTPAFIPGQGCWCFFGSMAGQFMMLQIINIGKEANYFLSNA